MKIRHVSDYRVRRRAEYPDIAEQLDAQWKGGEHAEEMRDRVMEVKRRFPKPPQKTEGGE